MLHLAIIGIVCAVSAPNEGTTFTGQKNYEVNTFCLSDEGKQAIGKVIFPRVYNVDVHNSSDCAKQKITNRTSSSFYDYFIKQYQSSRNKSCSVMEKVFLEREKNFRSDVDFTFRKRNLLWKENKSALKPIIESENCEKKKCKKRHCKTKKKKNKIKQPKIKAKSRGLNKNEKRLLLRLKNLKVQYPGSLYSFEMKNLDFDKRLQKFQKKVVPEDKEEREITKAKNLKQENCFSQNLKKLFFSKNIKKIVSSGKDYPNNSNTDVMSASLPVNNERGKSPVNQRTGYVGKCEVPATVNQTTTNSEVRKNPQISHSKAVTGDIRPMYEKILIAKPYPYSVYLKENYNSLHPTSQKFIPGRKKKKRHHKIKWTAKRPKKDLKNWPFFKKFFDGHSGIYNENQREYRKHTSIDKLAANQNLSSFAVPDFLLKEISEKPSKFSTDLISADEIKEKEGDVCKTAENLNLSLNTSEAIKYVNTEGTSALNSTKKYKGDVLPDHTIEKPFLARDSKNKDVSFEMQDSNFKGDTTGPPSLSPNHRDLYQHFYKLSSGGFITPSRYLKIRHALREYITRNNLWKPSNKLFLKSNLPLIRKKRSGCKNRLVSQKCWRSAPLLCIPYIKKGQEDVLKYLVRVIEKMMGKPFPPKNDIFEKTKYKPSQESATQTSLEDALDDFNVNDGTTENCNVVKSSIPACTTPQVGNTPHPCNADLCPTTPKTSFTTLKPPPVVSVVSSTLRINNPPTTNSWLSTVPLYVPRQEEIRDQSGRQSNDKLSQAMNQFPDEPFRYIPPLSTVPTPASSPSPSTSASPETTSASAFLKPLISNSSIDPCSTAPVPDHTTLATSREAPLVSTVNSCTFYISSSSLGQEGYYPLAPQSYKMIPEYSRVKLCPFLEEITPRPINQELTIPSFNQKRSQANGCEEGYEALKKQSPNIQETLQFPTLTEPIPLSSTEETFQDQDYYQTQDEDMQNNLKMREEVFSDYPLEFNNFKKKGKSHKYESSKHLNKKKGYHYDDYLLNESNIPFEDVNAAISKRKPAKKKHKSKVYKQKLNSQIVPDSFIDYYLYEKYPLPIMDEINKIYYAKHPKKKRRMHHRKSFYKKMKEIENQDSLARKKREDDYDWPDIYSEYLDDSSNKDEYVKKHAQVIPDENPPDTGWTPPSYDMFNELAKAITDSNTTEPESADTTTFETTITDTTTEVSDSKNISQKIANQATTSPSETKTSQNQTKSAQNGGENSTVSKTSNFSNKNISSTVPSCQTLNLNQSLGADAEFVGKKNVFNDSLSKTLGKSRYSDYIKQGKASFFQSNSRTNLTNLEPNAETSKNSKKDSGREEKEWKVNQDSDSGEGQVPTTLKIASIVKGQKKLLTKPSPKVYSRVYPDFLDFEFETNETTTAVTTSKTYTENKTALLSSTLKPDVRLQLLAICEGYLEIIKRIKAQNQTFGEDLDAQLARYCENIISQSFNNQLEKPKKAEPNDSVQVTTLSSTEETENSKSTSKVNLISAPKAAYENDKEFPDAQIREKVVDDVTNDSVDSAFKKETKKKIKSSKLKKKKLENIIEKKNLTETDSEENTKAKKKKRKKKKNDSPGSPLKEDTDQKSDETEEGILKKGITDEQLKLIHLLRKRKRALMSWLLNSKDQYKTDENQETEYFDDEDFIPPDSDFSEYSGTIKPKRNDKNYGTTKGSLYFVNETIFPVYAKHYGYDKGGELREVEVLWRKVNEKTHEEKILKNMSVIAFLMTPTTTPNKGHVDTKLLGSKGYEGDDMPEVELKSGNNVGFAAEMAAGNDKTSSTVPKTEKPNVTIQHNSTVRSITSTDKIKTTEPRKNATYTFISKPDPSSIVGAPPNKTKAHQNVTRKASHKFDVAKDLFQEYSIEFLNYAVYILPAMFTIMFFFCCFGCALYIVKTKRSFKKMKRKKKKALSTDSSETTEESEDTHKQRKREAKRKKKSRDDVEDEVLEKKKKKFWNVLKMPSKPYREPSEENPLEQSEKKNFLRFLKGKKDETERGKIEEGKKFSKNYDTGDERVYRSDESRDSHRKSVNKADDNNEAVERRELISLLEELKKIELEQTGEKKEVKSVHVQYMTQEDENPVYQRPEFSYPYEKNVFGLPKGYFFCSKKFPSQQMDPPVVKDYELYEDVSEMTELLPCECSYYAKKNDCLRHCDFRLNQEGRCKRFFKIFRDSGVNQSKPFRDKNFRANESENRSFIFNKYRSINTDTSEELMGVTNKNAGTEVRLTDNASPFTLSSKKNAGLVEEMENLKRQLSKKKYVRLKDDGVLCRL